MIKMKTKRSAIDKPFISVLNETLSWKSTIPRVPKKSPIFLKVFKFFPRNR